MPCLLCNTSQCGIQLKGREHLQAAAAAPLLGRVLLLGCCHAHSCRAIAAATLATTTTTTSKAQVPGVVLSVQEAQVVKVPRRT